MRGPSGQGASRLACATWSLKVFHDSRDTKHESRLSCISRLTRHETRLFRITAFTALRFTVVRDGWRHRKPPSGPLPPPASRCFPVHYCSPLFSKKILSCASALAPPGHCFPAPVRVAWRGYGAAWAAAVPRAVNTARKVFTNHETQTRDTAFMLFTRQESRNMVFPCSSGDSRKSNPKPGQQVFHESRDTNHGFYASLPTISHDFPAFPGPPPPPGKGPRAVQSLLSCALWRGMGRLWRGMGGGRTGNRACWVFTSHETRNMVFPCSFGGSRESSHKPGQRLFHESRVTNHGLYAFLPTISRHFPLFFGSPLPPEPVSAYRQPQLSLPSGLLPPRRT